MSFPRYESYRDSGVEWLGKVPSHWKTQRLRILVEIKKRIAGVEGLDVLSITQRGIKVKDVESNDGQLAESYAHYQIVKDGDFAMNHMDLLTGWIDVAKQSGVTSPDYRVFALRDGSDTDPGYLLRVLQNSYARRIFYAFGQGASHLGRWRLPTEEFQDFAVPLPPTSEQASIATFLDRETAKIDALVEAQRRLIELLKEKHQAVISHAVTKGLDPSAPMKDSSVKWLGEVPAHWEILPIKRRLTLATSGPRGWSDFMSDEGALFFQSQNIGRRMEAIFTDASRVLAPDDSESVRAQLCEEDVVVCITGGRTAAVAHIRGLHEVAYINQHVCLLRAEDSALNGRYLAFSLASHEGQSQMDVASYGLKQGLGLTDLKNIFIAAPPVREQQEIVDDLDVKLLRIERLAQQAEQAVSLLQERRAALISAAVTGKIDVRGLAANLHTDEVKAA